MLHEIKDAITEKKLTEWILDNYFNMNEDQKRRLMLELAFMIDVMIDVSPRIFSSVDIQGMLNANLDEWDEIFE